MATNSGEGGVCVSEAHFLAFNEFPHGKIEPLKYDLCAKQHPVSSRDMECYAKMSMLFEKALLIISPFRGHLHFSKEIFLSIWCTVNKNKV